MDEIEQLLQHDAEILRANADRYATLRPRQPASSAQACQRGMRHRAAMVTLMACCAAALLVLLCWQFISPPGSGPHRPGIAGKQGEPSQQDLVDLQRLTADTFTWAEGLAEKSRPAAPEVVTELRRQIRADGNSMRRILAGLWPKPNSDKGSDGGDPSSPAGKKLSGI